MEAEAYKLATSKLQGRLIAPYQREGVLWMLMRELGKSSVKGGFLCDEMGLGKTIQALTAPQQWASACWLLSSPQQCQLARVPRNRPRVELNDNIGLRRERRLRLDQRITAPLVRRLALRALRWVGGLRRNRFATPNTRSPSDWMVTSQHDS